MGHHLFSKLVLREMGGWAKLLCGERGVDTVLNERKKGLDSRRRKEGEESIKLGSPFTRAYSMTRPKNHVVHTKLLPTVP